VKWGALVYLSRQENITCINQVAYFRRGPNLMLQTENDDKALPEEVWNHFSDLNHIKRLEKKTNLKINVLDREFKPESRRKFIREILRELDNIKGQKIVFLDQDTGIEPKNSKPEHVTSKDLQEIWNSEALLINDLLVVYQHADRTKKWLLARKETMSKACGGAEVRNITGTGIASDVAMLWCKKSLANRSATDRESIIESDLPKLTEATWKPGICFCGCGEKPREGIFMPGHDGRISGWILQIERKGKKASDFPAHIADLYALWIKAGKPGGDHPRLRELIKRTSRGI
jgi:hypothetical protein